jgi:hypothetical protein
MHRTTSIFKSELRLCIQYLVPDCFINVCIISTRNAIEITLLHIFWLFLLGVLRLSERHAQCLEFDNAADENYSCRL